MKRTVDRTSFSRRSVLKLTGAGLVLAGAGSLPEAAGKTDTGDIPVGALMPLTGSGGSFGPTMLKAVQAALKDINGAGGPLGRKIRLIEEDDETSPEAAVRAAKKLVEVDKVVAIIGTWASGVTLAVAPVAQNAQVIEMSTSGSSRITAIQKKGFVYRTEPDDVLFGKAYAEFGLQQGWKTCSVLGLNVPFTATTVESFRLRFQKKGGKVASFATYNEDQTTFRSEVLKAFEGNPDFILVSGYEPDTAAILKAAYESGLKGKWVLPGFSVSEASIKSMGAAAEGVYLLEEGVAEGEPVYEKLAKALGTGQYYSFAAQTFDMINLVALAIEAAGSASGPAINARMREVSGPGGQKVFSFSEGAKILRDHKQIDYDGASGPIDFNADGNIGRANFRVAQIKGGKIIPIGAVKDVKF